MRGMKTTLCLLLSACLLAACADTRPVTTVPRAPDLSRLPPATNMGPGGPHAPAGCAVFNDPVQQDDSAAALSPQTDTRRSVDTGACQRAI